MIEQSKLEAAIHHYLVRGLIDYGFAPDIGTLKKMVMTDATSVRNADDAPRLRDVWLQTWASENPGEAEARVRGSNGSYRWFLNRMEPSRDEAGAVAA